MTHGGEATQKELDTDYSGARLDDGIVRLLLLLPMRQQFHTGNKRQQ